MVKSKKNKKGLSEKIAIKKGGVTKLNPFDVRTVRTKQKILGRRTKDDVGKPGVARAKAIQVRKDTLLQEYKLKDKNNMFMDKRIGEKDTKLSAEDKMIARYTAERLKGSGKQSIFNLGDDNAMDLTHGGRTINDMEKFDNPNSDDDQEEEERLNHKFVEEAHFGGFMTKTDDEFKEGRGNTRKEWIESLIKDSKKRKAEKRQLGEEMEEKTNALDTNWKEMFGAVRTSTMARKRDEEEAKPADYDPYDMLVRQLGYEKKEARGSERLKTDEEKVKEEKEKLDKLEEDRLRRMRGERAQPKKSGVSCEDMNDEQVKKKNKMSKKEKRALLKTLLSGEDGAEEGSEGEEEEDEDESEGEEEEDSDEEEEDDDEDDDEDEEDKYSDLEEDKEDAEPMDPNEKDRFDAETAAMISKATAELPYAFSVPESYEQFSAHIAGRSAAEVGTILERILKCNHPSLADGNKEKLAEFYNFLLQFVNDCAASFDEEAKGDYNLEHIGLQVIEITIPFLFQMTAMFQAKAAVAVQGVIKEKFDAFAAQNRKSIPGLETLVFVKLVLLLFPASDYRHPVVTPVLTLACTILARARPTDRATLAGALVLAGLLTEAVQLSKRFVPELINFVCGIFHVSCAKPSLRPVPPCRGGEMLILSKKYKGDIVKIKLSDVTSVKDIDEKFKVASLHTACQISLKLIEFYRELPSAKEVFRPLLVLLKDLGPEFLPKKLRESLQKIRDDLENLPEKAGAVVKPVRQVKMLRMLEPKIEEDFKPFEKKRTGDKTLLEEQKLRHKIKQERKGARKEIRKDVAFLAVQKAKERRQKDDDRRLKTKSLMASLANQEGDFQTIQRKKKKF